ncbi:MAG: hypothetical protein ACOC4C_03680 [Fibrobacterota bacterium]
MNIIARFVLFALATIIFHYGCSSPVAGSGSQTTNGLVVSMRNDSVWGVGRPDMTVELLSTDYLPINDNGYRAYITIDADSTFTFFGLDSSKTYNMFAFVDDSSSAIYISQLQPHVDSSVFVNRTYEYSSTGSVTGTLVVDKEQTRVPSLIYFVGTPFMASVSGEQMFRLANIPLGRYHLKSVNELNIGSPITGPWDGQTGDSKDLVIQVEEKETQISVNVSEID